MGQREKPPVTARGVYNDLSLSPYEFTSPYGDSFKFSSRKKLDIYTRDVPGELERVQKLVGRHDLDDFIPMEVLHLIYRSVYKAFYRKVER